MKKVCFLSIAIVTFSFIQAQVLIPNGDFGTYWPSSPGQPNGWTDSRDISQVSPGHGNGGVGWAAQGYKSAGTYPAYITSSAGAGISISTAYTYFNLFYKFASVSSDFLIISVSVRNSSGSQIGSGIYQVFTSVGSFTGLSIPINYSGSGVYDVIISVLMNPTTGSNPHVGSNFIIDDLYLSSAPLAVDEIEKESSALRLYPNPASGFVQLHLEDNNAKTEQLQIINALGEIVKEQFVNSNTANIDISNLASGNYIVVAKNDELIRTKRLVIQ